MGIFLYKYKKGVKVMNLSENTNLYIQSMVLLTKNCIGKEDIRNKDILSFIEAIGGTHIVKESSMYDFCIKRNKDKFELISKDIIEDDGKDIYLAIELGHLILDMKVYDKEIWLNTVEDSAYFRYGRAMERTIAKIYAQKLINS